jgi:hypothetical protein
MHSASEPVTDRAWVPPIPGQHKGPACLSILKDLSLLAEDVWPGMAWRDPLAASPVIGFLGRSWGVLIIPSVGDANPLITDNPSKAALFMGKAVISTTVSTGLRLSS